VAVDEREFLKKISRRLHLYFDKSIPVKHKPAIP
jgi:hypothetical protein